MVMEEMAKIRGTVYYLPSKLNPRYINMASHNDANIPSTSPLIQQYRWLDKIGEYRGVGLFQSIGDY